MVGYGCQGETSDKIPSVTVARWGKSSNVVFEGQSKQTGWLKETLTLLALALEKEGKSSR